MPAYDDPEIDTGEACYDDSQWEHDWQAHDEDAGAEWHAELNCYNHNAADGSYMAGDPILDGSCDTGSHMQQ